MDIHPICGQNPICARIFGNEKSTNRRTNRIDCSRKILNFSSCKNYEVLPYIYTSQNQIGFLNFIQGFKERFLTVCWPYILCLKKMKCSYFFHINYSQNIYIICILKMISWSETISSSELSIDLFYLKIFILFFYFKINLELSQRKKKLVIFCSQKKTDNAQNSTLNYTFITFYFYSLIKFLRSWVFVQVVELY